MAGGIETLRMLAEPGVYEKLEMRTLQLFEGLKVSAKKYGVTLQLQRVGSMFGILFAPRQVKNFEDSLT